MKQKIFISVLEKLIYFQDTLTNMKKRNYWISTGNIQVSSILR